MRRSWQRLVVRGQWVGGLSLSTSHFPLTPHGPKGTHE